MIDFPIKSLHIAMRIVGELLINLVTVIIIEVTFVGVNSADQDELSLTEPGVKCGTVPIKYDVKLSNSSARTLTEHGSRDSNQGEGRVLHGQDANFGEWPWIAHLEVDLGNQEAPSVCSGTLINSQWVLGAGHCGAIGEPSQWKASFGLYNVDTPDPSAIEARIDRIIVHPNYSELNNDVALFHLANPVEYNKYIQPVCLINATVNLISYARNKVCLALGYGRLVNNKKASRLQELRIVVRESSECLPYLGKNGRLKEGAACTGPMSDFGATCRGDSGGPNVCYNSQQDRWELFGSVSYGPKLCDRRPGDKWMTAVVDLSRYVEWIRETVREGGRDGEAIRSQTLGDLNIDQDDDDDISERNET